MALLQAVGSLAISQALTALAFGFTSKSSLLRPVVSVVVAVLTWSFGNALPRVWGNRLHVALLSTIIWVQFLKTLDDLCLRGLSYDEETSRHPVDVNEVVKMSNKGVSETQKTQGSDFSQRLSFGLRNLWNMRGIGMSSQIQQIPPWSSKDPAFVPSRSQEMIRHVRNGILCYLVLDAFANQPPPDLANTMSPRHESLFSRLGEMDAEEAIFRFFATLGFWLNTFCVINLINSVMCFFFVTFGVYSVEEMPPIWGRLSDAYTLRHFWGKTWHQTLRRHLVGLSDFVCHGLLRMPKGSLLARYSKLLLCFFISGALHFPADLALGIHHEETNVVSFFVSTALAIMCEDGVQHLCTKFLGTQNRRWTRFVGYVWVVSFMYWMSPSWAYPAARVVDPRDRLVPFSVIGQLIELSKK